TKHAFSRASRPAISPGAARPEFFCNARSSISAGIASKEMPALASSICRARLCDARISGSFPRQMVIAKTSFREPLPLPIGEQFQHGRGGFLDRAARHVELRPTEFGTQFPGVSDFIGHSLTIDVIIVGGIGAHAQ